MRCGDGHAARRPSRLLRVAGAVVVATPAWLACWPAVACPFCDAVAATLRQEIAGAEAAVIGVVQGRPAASDAERLPLRITRRLKGPAELAPGTMLSVAEAGGGLAGERVLAVGRGGGPLVWSARPLSRRGEAYLVAVCEAEDEQARLRHCLRFLGDREPLLADDAYGEFAVAPYAAVRDLAADLDHDQLLRWIEESQTPAALRRLSLTLVGVCGDQRDLPMLEEMLKDEAWRREGLDALVACYLSLAGEAGLARVEEAFLANAEATASEVYQVIAAIRFHGTESRTIPQGALAQALHPVLARADMADLVIADLARWNDWTQVPRVVELFEESSSADRLLRVAIVTYLQACPLESGRQALLYVEAIDPVSVQRSGRFFAAPPRRE